MVFYNGTEDTPDHEVMKLSDAFEDGGDTSKGELKQPVLELVADVYNINAGHNAQILEACTTLKGYAEFVRRTRENQKAMPFAQAVNKAVDECIRDGILADFLRDSKSEVMGVSIFEFDREEYDDMVREESREEGAYDKAVSTARKALNRNIPRDVIAYITGLSVEEVVAL